MAWWQTAKVGDKVVCIKRGKWQGSATLAYYDGGPQYGDICTITSINDDGDDIMLRLAGYEDMGPFVAYRFRPIQKFNRSTETGMNIIRAIADGVREPEGVEA